MKNKQILVYIQATEKDVHPVSKKVCYTANVLANESSMDVIGVVFAKDYNENLITNLKKLNLTKIYIIKGGYFDNFIPENEVRYLEQYAKNCDIFLVPSTPEGRCISSMTAAKLKTGCTADCTSLEFDEEGFLIQTRPAFSGNVMASIITKKTKPQIASLKYKKPGNFKARDTKIEVVEDNQKSSLFYNKVLKTSKITNFDGDIEQISLVLGNAINSKSDLNKFKDIASRIGAKLHTTRALVDKGIAPKSMQVGLSGKTISSKLLIVVGASGSVQFMSGIERADKIIAVNLNENAPIMRVADYPIVMDINEMINS